MQFDTNSDCPLLSASGPPEFPPVKKNPCARITTRIYHPSKDTITIESEVLVRMKHPPNLEDMNSSSSSIESFMSAEDDDDAPLEAQDHTEDRAYLMKQTLREAIYGRVVLAVVLKKHRIREAEWVVTDERCAIKEMSWQHIRKERDKLAEDPIKEVEAMQYLKCWYEKASLSDQNDSFMAMNATNIMMPMDLLTDDQYLYSVMPFCDGGELFEVLDMNEKFTEDEARHWMCQVLNGIENLQRAGICHRDMSLENLLVHQNGCLIIDLGMCLKVPLQGMTSDTTASFKSDITASFNSMNLDNGENNQLSDPLFINGRKCPRHPILPQGVCGKWIYMSPEIYKNQEPFDGFAVDMWAAGVILFLMVTGFPPWERACEADERFKYMSGGYLVQMLTEWDMGLSSDAMDLLQRMMWLDPKDRLSLDQVRAHPWMKGASL